MRKQFGQDTKIIQDEIWDDPWAWTVVPSKII